MLGTEPELIEKYVANGQVQLVFNPVLNHGERSEQSHMAAECAGDQGKFWEFRHILFENHRDLWRGDINATVKRLAQEAGLDTEAFNACLDGGRYFERIYQQDELRISKGIPFQPSFEVNGTILIGLQGFDTFTRLIDLALEGN